MHRFNFFISWKYFLGFSKGFYKPIKYLTNLFQIIHEHYYALNLFLSNSFQYKSYTAEKLNLNFNQRIYEGKYPLIYKVFALETLTVGYFLICKIKQDNALHNLLKSFELCFELEEKYSKNKSLKISSNQIYKKFLDDDLIITNVMHNILFREIWKNQTNPEFLAGFSELENAVKFLDYIICNFDKELSCNSNPLVIEKVALAHKIHVLIRPRGIAHFHHLRAIELLTILDKYYSEKTITNRQEKERQDILKLQLAESYHWMQNNFLAMNLINDIGVKLHGGIGSKQERLIARQYMRRGEYDKAILTSLDVWHKIPALESKGDFNESIRLCYESFMESDRLGYPDIPQWSRSKVLVDLFEETVLLTQWDKCGGGDEILFAEVILNLKSLGKNLYIETEPRCYDLMKNSFPENIVFNVGTLPPWEKDTNLQKPTIQLHTRSYAFHLYRSINYFPRPQKYLQADFNLAQKWRSQIDSISSNKLKVGINWRSYWTAGETSYHSLCIRDLKLMFSEIKDDIQLFNLQYDITEQEKKYISDKLDLDIYDPEIDQMNDFHNLAAFISQLDVVICPPTTIYDLTGAVGTKIILLRTRASEEYSYLSLGWFKNQVTVIKDHNAPWDTILPLSLEQLII